MGFVAKPYSVAQFRAAGNVLYNYRVEFRRRWPEMAYRTKAWTERFGGRRTTAT